jgi:hypothetical protein
MIEEEDGGFFLRLKRVVGTWRRTTGGDKERDSLIFALPLSPHTTYHTPLLSSFFASLFEKLTSPSMILSIYIDRNRVSWAIWTICLLEFLLWSAPLVSAGQQSQDEQIIEYMNRERSNIVSYVRLQQNGLKPEREEHDPLSQRTQDQKYKVSYSFFFFYLFGNCSVLFWR